MTIFFLYGWTSVPGGLKPTFMMDQGHTVINPKFPDEDFAEAVRIAQSEFDRHRPAVVVGSSRGGAVAMNTDSGSARLILFCPAWRKSASVWLSNPVISSNATAMARSATKNVCYSRL